jgi:hypothetical protein
MTEPAPHTEPVTARLHHKGQWIPATAENIRAALEEDVLEERARKRAAAEQAWFTVNRDFGADATASERGQQHIRLALAMSGSHLDLDTPELFDQVADAIPAVIADLHALARRLGLHCGGEPT